MKKIWTEEEKEKFLEAFRRHKGDDVTVHAAYKLACDDLAAEGMGFPGFSTFERWIYKRGEDAAVTAETEKNQERLLKSIIRLYRTRSEEAIDALVDELFPNITEVEE